MPRSVPVAMVLVASLLGACGSAPTAIEGSATRVPSTTSTPISMPSLLSPTPPAIPKNRPTSGPVSAACVNGWVTPPETSHLFTEPLVVIRRSTGVKGPLVVVDMRYFTGPESPSDLSSGDQAKAYLAEVDRWYVKLYSKDDLSFQGRFLVESRRFGRGLPAVAPYDTRGWRSPDWRGFQYDAGNTQTRVVPRLPGAWSGVEYDFVKGGAGLDFPGLPDQVVGCLTGT